MYPEPFPILFSVPFPNYLGPSQLMFLLMLSVHCLNEVMCLPGAAFKTWAGQKHGVPLLRNLASRTAPVLKLYSLSHLASTAPFYLPNILFIWVWGGTWA